MLQKLLSLELQNICPPRRRNSEIVAHLHKTARRHFSKKPPQPLRRPGAFLSHSPPSLFPAACSPHWVLHRATPATHATAPPSRPRRQRAATPPPPALPPSPPPHPLPSPHLLLVLIFSFLGFVRRWRQRTSWQVVLPCQPQFGPRRVLLVRIFLRGDRHGPGLPRSIPAASNPQR
jgi:hypothetical protein